MEFLKNPNYEFESKAKYFIALSVFFIAAGLAFMFTRGVNYGVEFSGGTQLIAQFQGTPDTDKIRHAQRQITELDALKKQTIAAELEVIVVSDGHDADTAKLFGVGESYEPLTVTYFSIDKSQQGVDISTAAPSLARVRTISRMSRLAPASTPWDGSSRSSTRG